MHVGYADVQEWDCCVNNCGDFLRGFVTVNEERHDLSSQNIIWVIKSRRMRWAGHMEHNGR
jgi:hypothetical protein